MASTYVNDLRLNEMATGDASGSWGTITNTNLELIGEAFGYGTESIGNADTTITMADGASDAARSFYLKITSSADLTTTRVITLAPNTVSKVWMIENATSGSQIITIKQGTGATINIPNGHVKMVATDGAGSGGAVLDLLTDLNVATNLFVKNAGTGDGSTANIYLQTAEADIAADDVIGKINFQAPNEGTGTDAILVSAAIQAISEGDFSSSSNATSLNFMTGASEAATTKMTLSSAGNLTVTGIVDVTDTTDASDATGDTGALRTEGGASIAKKLYVGTDLDVDGTTNLDVVDIDGAVDMASTLQVDGAITSSAGATITTADNTDTLQLVSTDADANIGPNLRLYRNSSSPADSDTIGVIDFEGRNDNSQDFIAARMNVLVNDVSDGSEDSTLFINTMLAGTVSSRIKMDPSETIFNEDSKDLDVRIEGNARAKLFVADAGVSQVGIGMTPDQSWGSNSVGINFGIADADAGWIGWEQISGGDNFHMLWNVYHDNSDYKYASNNPAGKYTQNSGAHTFSHAASGTADDTISFVENLKLNSSGAVFNEGSADIDFRVESNGNANMLFVDGGNDQVVIGGNTQKTTAWQSDARGLTVVGAKPTIVLHDEDNANYFSFISQVSGDQYIYNEAGGNVYFGNAASAGGAGATYMQVNNSGAVIKPLQPAFLARPTSDQDDIAINTDVTVVLGTEVFDQNADFASNIFTAPVTGKYQFSFCLNLRNLDSGANYYEAQIVTSNRNYNFIIDPDFGQDAVYWSITGSALCDMDASDTARFKVVQSGGNAQTDISTESHFSGFLAC